MTNDKGHFLLCLQNSPDSSKDLTHSSSLRLEVRMIQAKQCFNSGTVWEGVAGYSRAVRIGDRILVSGTTATGADGQVVGGGDAAAQARFILDKIETALVQLGSRLEDIIRTRIYLRNIDDWEPVAHVHGERFAAIRPANTLVEARLVGDDYLVEIEAEAVVGVGGVG
jgi:enamine deaminase RidA (YjgF/YER057c/UK114 family)